MECKLNEEQRIQLHHKCLADGKIGKELQAQYDKRNLPNDEKTRCFVKCYFIGAGLFTEEGFNETAWKQYLQKHFPNAHKLEHDLQECIKPKYDDLCTAAYEGYKCLVTKGLTKVNPTFN